ncbi:MAG TPA: leucyl aminopeptidase [Acidimicrobiales bacterium]|jgi:leucyl aminopeptidase|nr:leucyl aminopeptidase [Acidimicrobiales bacterium]
MTTSVRVAHGLEPIEGCSVVLPVARDEEGLLIPRGLPAEFSGAAVPDRVDSAWAAREGFEAKVGQTLAVRTIDSPTVVLCGIGDAASADAEVWRRVGAAAMRASSRGAEVALLLPLPSTIETRAVAQAVCEGALLASSRPIASKTSPPDDAPSGFVVVPVALEGVSDEDRELVDEGAARGATVAEAVCWARELINRPAAQLTPRRFAHEAVRRLEHDPNVTVDIWRDTEIENERLGGLLGVAAGSLEPPRLVRATYSPPGATSAPHVVLVGKGITFDSGGLSLKTPDGMTTMKTDMTGAAIVLGALSVAARLGASAKVTAIAPLTENLPGNRAMRPGDVLTARNGTTIEVLNTDAEGRLVLADGLSLAVELEPDAIIDVATLTGAVRIALGPDVAAILGTDATLVSALRAFGEAQGEALWELPLVDSYESHLDSDVADVKNIGKPGQAGTIVAGLFLRRFTGGRPWAHLDVAATGRAEADDGYLQKGATGFSLRTLVAYLLSL